MKSKTYLILGFCFSVIFFNSFSYQASPDSSLFSQQAKNHLNLVVISRDCPNQEDFSRDIYILKTALFSITPFNRFQDKIRFWRLSLTDEEYANIFQEKNSFPYLFLRQDFLNDILAKIGGNYKLVIIDYTGSVSAAEVSKIDKISLIIVSRKEYRSDQKFSKAFFHELGHALGLREENPNSVHSFRPGKPNCATTKEDALAWWGDLAFQASRVSYYYGCCGNKNYIRPTSTSFMNNIDKAKSYGPVNERYLREGLKNF